MKLSWLFCTLLVACGETVSLGDGKQKADGATDHPMPGPDAHPDGTVGAGSDSAPQDSATEHPVWQPCAERLCNDPCHVCDPADPQCVEPPEPHRCDPHGECTSHSVVCG